MRPPCYDEVNKKDCPNRTADCARDCLKWKKYVEKREETYHARLLETRAYVRKIT